MKIKVVAAVSLALSGSLAGCSSELQRSTPIGQTCYRKFSYEEYPRYYGCLFELSAPSAFYDDAEVNKVLDRFVAAEGGKCTVQPERDVADVATEKMDHGLRYRLFNVECR